MRILTLDIGNTAVKCTVFRDGRALGSSFLFERIPELLGPFFNQVGADAGIYCNVAGDAREFVKRIESLAGIEIMEFTHSTPVPIGIEYSTPGTLGLDRIAAAVGALLEADSALVVDAGTAITLDVVGDKSFKGGNISPGLDMRFRALHEFTSRLPLLGISTQEPPRFGDSTSSAIMAGVIQGSVAEIISAFNDARELYPDARLIMTGGNALELSRFIKVRGVEVETNPDLVGRGLEEILLYSKLNSFFSEHE